MSKYESYLLKIDENTNIVFRKALRPVTFKHVLHNRHQELTIHYIVLSFKVNYPKFSFEQEDL